MPQPDPHTMPAQAPESDGTSFWPQVLFFFHFRSTYSVSKSKTNRSRNVSSSDFGSFWDPVLTAVLQHFLNPQYWTKFQSTFYVVSALVLDPLFHHVYHMMSKNTISGTPSESSWAQNSIPTQSTSISQCIWGAGPETNIFPESLKIELLFDLGSLFGSQVRFARGFDVVLCTPCKQNLASFFSICRQIIFVQSRVLDPLFLI